MRQCSILQQWRCSWHWMSNLSANRCLWLLWGLLRGGKIGCWLAVDCQVQNVMIASVSMGSESGLRTPQHFAGTEALSLFPCLGSHTFKVTARRRPASRRTSGKYHQPSFCPGKRTTSMTPPPERKAGREAKQAYLFTPVD